MESYSRNKWKDYVVDRGPVQNTPQSSYISKLSVIWQVVEKLVQSELFSIVVVLGPKYVRVANFIKISKNYGLYIEHKKTRWSNG